MTSPPIKDIVSMGIIATLFGNVVLLRRAIRYNRYFGMAAAVGYGSTLIVGMVEIGMISDAKEQYYNTCMAMKKRLESLDRPINTEEIEYLHYFREAYIEDTLIKPVSRYFLNTTYNRVFMKNTPPCDIPPMFPL